MSTATVTATAPTLQDAMKDHAGGRFDAARRGYAQLLVESPEHPDALHLLGVLEAQQGHRDEAARLIARAIAANPREAMFHNNLGNVLTESGRLSDAEASYRQAAALAPERPDVFNNLGVLLSRLRRPEEGEQMLLQAIELAPGFADARQNLANLYLRLGRVHDALRVCVDALIIAPRNPVLRKVLGAIYVSLGKKAEAEALYRAWLEQEPDSAEARFRLTALTGQDVPAQAPPDYVAKVFDSFAASFDSQLAALSYRAPELVAAAVNRHLPVVAPAAAGAVSAGGKQLDIIDAGCGTGLCGPLLASHARRLVGVDLSAGMLKKAADRSVYDELVCSELVAFLRERPAACNLLVSADTLCYFGALEAFAAAARAALRPGGLLVFTVEAHADEAGAADFVLQGHGRYSHRRGYLEAVLAAAGLPCVELEAAVLRKEAGEPVQGWVVSARMVANLIA